jgi:hypothetical protein
VDTFANKSSVELLVLMGEQAQAIALLLQQVEELKQ